MVTVISKRVIISLITPPYNYQATTYYFVNYAYFQHVIIVNLYI